MQKAHLPVYKVPPPPTTTIQPAKGVGRGRGVAKTTTTGFSKPTHGARIFCISAITTSSVISFCYKIYNIYIYI
jgi:hypothetical protein